MSFFMRATPTSLPIPLLSTIAYIHPVSSSIEVFSRDAESSIVGVVALLVLGDDENGCDSGVLPPCFRVCVKPGILRVELLIVLLEVMYGEELLCLLTVEPDLLKFGRLKDSEVKEEDDIVLIDLDIF